ncbi:MAG TPA: thiamine pyrophosphate-binding protein [Candidatus Omnitrophota bacterium]|nr:thiamine pyrophosphate-binding protein [Candidatus Omnitrophota bacterium]
MKVSDYIVDFIYRQGVKEVFMVTGGGMMFLSDSVCCHPKLKAVFNHHEQASAMAAVAYAKYTGNLGAAMVTTGCGGTNTITGLLNSWQDSTPCIFISGQSKRKETVKNSGLGLRQFGVQEADIVSIVKPITKYAVMVNNPAQIAYHLEKAVYLAKSGRPGPVWLDIPLDVQGALISKKDLVHFHSGELKYKIKPSQAEIAKFKNYLSKSSRPVIICGQGVRLSAAIQVFKNFIAKYKIPVVASHLGIDILPTAHHLFIGRIGNKGDRAGNFALQNSDLVIVLGSRLSVSSTGHEYHLFARKAKVIVVDIDPVEHKKNTVKIDLLINADIDNFLKSLPKLSVKPIGDWVGKCKRWKKIWPVCLPQYRSDKKGINLYYFVNQLSKVLKNNSVVIADAGSSFYVLAQSIQLSGRQRYITSGGQAEMGFTVPASIGVCFAKDKKETIGITGDGSFQMNLQELQTIVHNRLPVKLFIWNNNGYLSIRSTQARFFNGRTFGTDQSCGVSFPEIKKIAAAYGIQYYCIRQADKIRKVMRQVLKQKGPVICEVICQKNQQIIPTASSMRRPDGSMVSKPLEDMYPFLDRKTFFSEMIVKPVEE